LQGTVTFSSSGVNPAQGLVELPQNVTNPAELIAANPCIQAAENAFTLTGKGGVPSSPNDVLSGEYAPFAWVEFSEGRGTSPNSPQGGNEEGKRKEVVPAQGWVINASGDVTLVGYNSGDTTSRNPRQNPVCLPR
jgi:large exoprotein involved in heme utilization and adhesion